MNPIRDSYPKVDEHRLDLFEKQHQLTLPPRYRNFLLTSNGGRPLRPQFSVPGWPGGDTSLIDFFGVHEGEECNLSRWRAEVLEELPKQFLAIGVDGWGNLLCLDTQPPYADHIYYWDSSNRWDLPPEGPTMFEVAKDIDEFIEAMTEEDPID